MKKIKMLISIFAILMILLPLVSTAETEQKVNQKEPKATDIKIHKKQVLSDDERKAIDEAKGKPTDKKPTGRVFGSWATGVLGEPIPMGGKRYAIVVGLANYTGTANDLCSVKTDASDTTIFGINDARYYCQDYDSVHMRQALIDEYGYNNENIILLRDAGATKTSIVGAMNELSPRLTNSDEIVFFFSGHGVSGNYYGIVDSERVDEAIYTYDGQFVWDDDLKVWADNLSTYREAFIFDMCLAGGMNDIAGANRVIAMSSGENQSSWTYTLGGGGTSTSGYTYSEGLFSHYFVVSGMTNMLADSVNLLSKPDNQVAVEEAFSYTYPIIKTKQVPVLDDKYLNDLVLGK